MTVMRMILSALALALVVNQLVAQKRPQPVAKARSTEDAAHHDTGRFQKVSDSDWTEFSHAGEAQFFFKEVKRDDNYIYLRDESRKFVLALPKTGGTTVWQYDGENPQDWRSITWKPVDDTNSGTGVYRTKPKVRKKP